MNARGTGLRLGGYTSIRPAVRRYRREQAAATLLTVLLAAIVFGTLVVVLRGLL